MRTAIRLVIYWVVSIVSAGLVANLASLPTYAGSSASFADRFTLYATPFPVALGMLHIPALAIGSLICLAIGSRIRRVLVVGLGTVLAVALALHLLAHVAGFKDHWLFFMYGTADVAILWVLGLLAGAGGERKPNARRAA